jgi:DNA primase large subunit
LSFFFILKFFRNRLKKSLSTEIVKILENNGISIDSVDQSEKKQLEGEIQIFMKTWRPEQDLWKVKWTNVLSLVSNRQVVIKKGFAFLTVANLTSFIIQNYREKLQKSLGDIQKLLPYLEDDENERLVPFLNKLGNKNVGNEYKIQSGATYGPQEIDPVIP